MPEDLTSAVQRRAGRGKFSQYVTEAVARRLEVDLLAELSEVLAVEHGPVPPGYLAEARTAWPDGQQQWAGRSSSIAKGSRSWLQVTRERVLIWRPLSPAAPGWWQVR